jgi:phage recombination protein Bet
MTQLADAPAEAPANGNGNAIQRQAANLPQISAPRLPYHPAIEERFGVDRSSWKALVEAIFPLAQSTESVILALSYCRARKLDPFKRNVHIVPIWSKESGREVDTIWPGIGELRTTAFRTGEYAGRDAAVFGADKTQTFKGTVGRRGQERNVEETVTFPEWAQVTVYRLVRGQRVGFAGPKVHWIETYATMGRSDVPNDMWKDRPRGQLEKCAEAAALRAAFPEEVGSDYIPEEAEGTGARGVKHVESTPRGTTAVLNKLTTKPVSEGQEFVRDADAVDQVERQQIDTTTGEVSDPAPSPADGQGSDPDTAGAEAEPPPVDTVAEALAGEWADVRRVLISAGESSGMSKGDATKAVDAHVKLKLGKVGKENTITAKQRRELYDALKESRISPAGQIAPRETAPAGA